MHDPLAVAGILTGIGGEHEIHFYDSDQTLDPPERRRERYEVTVITEGSYEDAKNGAQTGRTLVRLLEPGEEGIRIPRGVNIPAFWGELEACVVRAEAATFIAN